MNRTILISGKAGSGKDTVAKRLQEQLEAKGATVLIIHFGDPVKWIARDFYNDTFMFDQNACTSPRIIVWHGNNISDAKRLFWNKIHLIAENEYDIPDIRYIDKFTKSCLFLANFEDANMLSHDDNLIIRIKVDRLSKQMIDYLGNCGFFIEYDCFIMNYSSI